ncbi:MAG: type sorting protein [Fluviicola sp.]|jgi:hypothetical protein|uniref:SGNH/GDSL hydrolase family protein n=1 Tax=Fluviicola sp. TaxID=1917219 RepID=UPI002613A6C7|nr:SGNH/GDSL hydrolase family protein [Fluviicola sp.]MDF3029002.1 type sorting protein [Fluviicola sp.]
MRNINKKFVLGIFILCSVTLFGQQTKRVLFLGNSYTHVNNLPQLLADIANSTGKTLIFDINAPGGYYIGQHLTNQTSLAKIASGNWDNVVLQDQSMALAYPSTYMNGISYSVKLDSIIKAHNLCAQTMFYSTWGRRPGDTYLCTPPECAVDTWITRTYYEMDSTITSHYKVYADSVKAGITPVGAAWRYIRQNYPSIELFQADESHPSLAGSYTAACCFYATLFRSDPTLITFNSGLSPTDAANIKYAVKQTVYDHLSDWNVGPYDYLLDASCPVLGAEENTMNEYWSVFPNPTTDVLHVKFSGNNAKNKVYIYDMLGVLIKEMELEQTATIDFNEFPSGLYIIKSDGEHSVKIVKR